MSRRKVAVLLVALLGLWQFAACAGGSAEVASLAPDAVGCEETCKGRATPDLGGEIRARTTAAASCYNRALADNPKVQGTMRLLLRIAPNGGICYQHVIASELPQSVTDCVLMLLGRTKYPPPMGGCVDATVPISFGLTPLDAGDNPVR